MKNKKFLVDTSVILDDPQNLISLFQNGLNEVYISDVILKELNGHKEDGINEKGFFAREFIRALDKGILTNRDDYKLVLPKKNIKNRRVSKTIQKEVLKKEGEDITYGFSCIFENKKDPVIINIINREDYKKENNTNDLKIVEIAKDYELDLITNDIALKLIALSKGIKSESLKKDSVNNPEDIDFKKEYSIKESLLNEALESIKKEVKSFSQITISILDEEGNDTGKKRFYMTTPNQNIEELKMEADDFSKKYAVAPLNLEQKFLLRMLAHPLAEIAVVTGSTGSGKTLMVLQEALRRVKDIDDAIDGIIYLRNTVNSNDKASELGFRKGDQNQKLNYFAYPLFGNINFISQQSFSIKKKDLKAVQENDSTSTSKEDFTEQFMKDYNIEVMDLAHARGVTLTNKFVIFDEVQNASNATLQLLGTRLGKNSRLVILGDYKQVDHPYLTKQRNGLVTMLKKAMTDDNIAGIQLRKTIRSKIANWFQENL